MAESAELLARARNGDADAFCEFAQACEGRLFRQAVSLCHDPTTAEDLTAETLIETWKSLGRFDGKCRFSTWLYAILVHRYQKSVRKARVRPVLLADLRLGEADEGELLLARAADRGPAPGDVLQQKELAEPLHEAVGSLPQEHQQVVLLRFYEGASLPEIASALGVPVGTVKSRLYYALTKLRRMQALVNLLRELGDT